MCRIIWATFKKKKKKVYRLWPSWLFSLWEFRPVWRKGGGRAGRGSLWKNRPTLQCISRHIYTFLHIFYLLLVISASVSASISQTFRLPRVWMRRRRLWREKNGGERRISQGHWPLCAGAVGISERVSLFVWMEFVIPGERSTSQQHRCVYTRTAIGSLWCHKGHPQQVGLKNNNNIAARCLSPSCDPACLVFLPFKPGKWKSCTASFLISREKHLEAEVKTTITRNLQIHKLLVPDWFFFFPPARGREPSRRSA